MSDERILEIVEKQDKYYILGFINGLRASIADLQQENKQLKEKLDKYENPDDMTLYTMWCTEKVKDKNKQLQERIDKAIKYIEKQKNYPYPTILHEDRILEILKGDK